MYCWELSVWHGQGIRNQNVCCTQLAPRQSLIALQLSGMSDGFKGIQERQGHGPLFFHTISWRWVIPCVFRSSRKWWDTLKPSFPWTVWSVYLLRAKTETYCVVVCPLGLCCRKNAFWLQSLFLFQIECNITKWTRSLKKAVIALNTKKMFKLLMIALVGVWLP